MTVRRIQCILFTSNIYVLEEDTSDSVWLIDCGDGEIIIPAGKHIKGVFITHPHVDHIMGLNALFERFPSMVVYTSQGTKDGLYNSKLNLSFYHEIPFIYKGQNVKILSDGDCVELLPGLQLKALETPGHNPACLSYMVGNYLFTGDSLIPGFPVVTKLKGGDKALAAQSEIRLKSLVEEGAILCPGHGTAINPI